MIDILYEDESLLVCVKPSGTLSELSDSPVSLPNMLCRDRKAAGEELVLYPIHRLDREVCGAIVFAKNEYCAKKLSEAVTSREIRKEYLAIIEGTPADKSATLCDLLFKDSSKNKSFVVKRERRGVKKASLSYNTLASRNGTSLISIELHTGRTHQIRVQFSSRGHSVLGDRKYGSSIKDSQIALCSHRLTFSHPKTKKTLDVVYTPTAEGLWATYASELAQLQ